MSADPIDPGALPWSPDPVRQRPADFTIEDVLTIRTTPHGSSLLME